MSIASWLGGRERLIHRLPGFDGWTKGRDMPAPGGETFRDLYRKRKASPPPLGAGREEGP